MLKSILPGSCAEYGENIIISWKWMLITRSKLLLFPFLPFFLLPQDLLVTAFSSSSLLYQITAAWIRVSEWVNQSWDPPKMSGNFSTLHPSQVDRGGRERERERENGRVQTTVISKTTSFFLLLYSLSSRGVDSVEAATSLTHAMGRLSPEPVTILSLSLSPSSFSSYLHARYTLSSFQRGPLDSSGLLLLSLHRVHV